jgi:RNA polymerase sigma factor (TIGR02999 family)
MTPKPGESGITVLLRAWSEGNSHALEELTPLIYEEIYLAARRYMARENTGHLLQNTALVNEVFVRLAKIGEVEWQDRSHFFAVCAQIMRRILVDYARSQHRAKRGGQAEQISLEDSLALVQEAPAALIALDDALQSLASVDERKSKVVELRFYGGLSVQEIAEVLKISEKTVIRDWRFAQLWLARELRGEPPL